MTWCKVQDARTVLVSGKRTASRHVLVHAAFLFLRMTACAPVRHVRHVCLRVRMVCARTFILLSFADLVLLFCAWFLLNRDIVLPYADLVLFCIKSLDPKKYEDLTALKQAPALHFAEELAKRQIPW